MISNSGTTSLGLYDFKRQIDAFGGVDYFRPTLAGGYLPNARVMLNNGEIVQNDTNGNLTNDPNVDMTGWIPDQYSKYGTTRAKTRSVQSKLKDIPSILDWDADSANDDSARIQKALLDGVDSLFIPPKSSYGVFKVGELELTKSIKLWGVGGQGIDQQSSVIQKVAGAAYALHFNGLGQTSRPLGGGLEDVMIYGVATEEADLIHVTRWSYFKALNTAFQNSKGWGLKLKNVMESTFSTNNFRRLGSESTGIILFDDYIDISSENCNNTHICGSTFALSSGDWIKSTDSSNPDLIWINNNKFEYDGTPSGNENINPKSVIHFGQMARAFVKDNGFTHFTNSHNKYDQIITMGSGCSGYGVKFKDNNILDCDKAYTINGGRFIARGNEAVNLIADGVITSNIACDVDEIIRKTTNGNIVSVKQTKLDPTFIPASRLGGTISRLFVADADSSSGQALTLTNTVGDNEIRRLTIPNYLINSGRVIKFTARVKNTSAIAATLKLVIDGSFTNPYSLNNSAVITASVSASSDYTNYSWYISPNNIGAGSLRLYSGGNGAILNFDGVFVDFAKYVDYSYTWNITSVASTTLAASPPQSLVFKDYIESVSAPSFDSAILDLIPSVSTYNSTNSFRATLFNPANTAVSITVTRVRVRVNLR